MQTYMYVLEIWCDLNIIACFLKLKINLFNIESIFMKKVYSNVVIIHYRRKRKKWQLME